MSALADLQHLFWRAARVSEPPAAVDVEFVSRGSLSARDRLAIYRTAHWVRLVEVLRELFPSVVEAQGDGPFAQLASRYLAAHPPTHRHVEGVGEQFPDWLSQHAPPLAGAAELDWASWCVFVAPDPTPVRRDQVDPATLAGAQLLVGPHVRLCGHTAVWRQGFGVSRLELEHPEALALDAARKPLAFADWCEAMAVPPEELVGRLHRWLERGWVVQLS
ncbi:MAG: putative DNA-binding domain-containing protein [Myxococcaceae bacterium]|nr:putative DNA-binding domain-containing protein [Myxococcaceae bacterium]